jgi:hypothetical protein
MHCVIVYDLSGGNATGNAKQQTVRRRWDWGQETKATHHHPGHPAGQEEDDDDTNPTHQQLFDLYT